MWRAQTVAPKRLSACYQRLLLACAARPAPGALLERDRMRPVGRFKLKWSVRIKWCWPVVTLSIVRTVFVDEVSALVVS